MSLEYARQKMEEHNLAIDAHLKALLEYEAALDALEDAKTRAILNGLEGRNETERKARLAELVKDEEERVRAARTALRIAESRLKKTKANVQLALEAIRLQQAA